MLKQQDSASSMEEMMQSMADQPKVLPVGDDETVKVKVTKITCVYVGRCTYSRILETDGLPFFFHYIPTCIHHRLIIL